MIGLGLGLGVGIGSGIITPGYVASAVHFDNATPSTTFLRCASLSSADNGFLAFSVWLKIPSYAGGQNLWVVDPAGAYTDYLQLGGEDLGLGGFDFDSGDASFSPAHQLDLIGAPGSLPLAAWVHLMGAIDTNHAAGLKVYALYVNDTLISPTATDIAAACIPIFNGQAIQIGDDTFGTSFKGDMADLWIAPGVNLLNAGVIPEATRRKFISVDGKPVSPANFPAGGAVLLSGNAASFGTNQGTGGAFVTTGTLTDAVTSPSD